MHLKILTSEPHSRAIKAVSLEMGFNILKALQAGMEANTENHSWKRLNGAVFEERLKWSLSSILWAEAENASQ